MYVDYERFESAVNRFAELVKDGHARIVLGPQKGAVGLNIDPGAPDPPVPGGGIYNDVEDTLAAVISNTSIDDFVKARASPRPPVFPETEGPAVARRKYELVLAAFPAAQLRLKAHLRWTSSVPVLTDLSWEILTRHADSADGERETIITAPYAVARVTAERSSENPFAPDRDVSSFAMDPEALDEVIESLGRLRTVLLSTEAST
jgi:hypothetical protein